MKDCQQLISFLMDYVEGELPEAHTDTFQMHLDACPECVAYVDSYQRTVKMTQSIRDEADDACDEMPEALVQAILSARRAS